MTDLKLNLEIHEPTCRLDKALLSALQKKGILISRSQLKIHLLEGQVLYRNKPTLGSYLLSSGIHTVVLLNWNSNLWMAPQAAPAPDSFHLPVIYEDENLLILDKKSGVPSLPHGNQEINTAVNFALAHVPSLAQVGKQGLEPGLLHRLDTQTSGLLVFAKTHSEFERLRIAWKTHQIRKYYRALIKTTLPVPTLLPRRLDLPLAHHAKSSKKMVALENSIKRSFRGKPLKAITHISRIHRLSEGLFDFEIQIETGVMHQIRCHLSAMGWPILGDTLYQGAPSERIWLHAWRLRVPLANGAVLSLEAMLPPGWAG